MLYRQFGLVYLGRGEARSRDGLPLRSRAPNWVARDQWGRDRSADEFLGLTQLLVFAEARCAPCAKLMPVLRELHERESEDLSILVVGGTDAGVSLAMVEKHSLDFPVLTQTVDDMTTAFRVTTTPFAFFIDGRGIIREKGIINHFDQIHEKLEAVPRVKGVFA